MTAPPAPNGVFLTAQWRALAMLNYPISPAVLLPRVPAGCELDFFRGDAFVSIVGFRFLNVHVLGFPIPFHRDFDEVNLRFYVRHRADDGEWRRGVVFVKEIVAKGAIAFVARTFYGENYVQHSMRSRVELPGHLRYAWHHRGRWESITATTSGESDFTPDDSEETFITEHYWGYAKQRDGGAMEYAVEHPRWRVWHCDTVDFRCDVAKLYGPEFAEALSGPPSSAFVADGSEVVVRRGRRVT